MKFFKPTTFNVIFLIPVAVVASRSGGCATTQEARPGPLASEQIEQTIAGNTMKAADQEAYAYVGRDGTLKGLNLPNGATAGQWRVSDNGVLCAAWNTPQGSKENCDQLSLISREIGYQWGGNSLLVLEGNPKNL